MALQRINIPYPLRGLSENYQFSIQEPGTTRDMLNMRSIDPTTGRTRGAQRSGRGRFLDDTHSGLGKIAELIDVPIANVNLTYTLLSDPDTVAAVFSKALPTKDTAVDLKTDEFDNIYVVGQQGVALKMNQTGGVIAKIKIPDESDQAQLDIGFISVDPYGNVVVGKSNASSISSGVQAEGRLYGFELRQDGLYYQAWTLDTGRTFEDAVFHQRSDGEVDMFCLESDWNFGDSFFTVYENVKFTTSTPPAELTASRVTLDNSASGVTTAVTASRMVKRDDGVCYITGFDQESTTLIDCKLWKVNPYQDDPGAIIAESSLAATSGAGEIDGGIGFGVALGPDNSDGDPTIYVCGNDDDGDFGVVRRIVDAGTSFSESGTDHWVATLSNEWSEAAIGTRRLRLATDKDNRLYVPAPGAETENVLIFDTDGTELKSFTESAANATTLAVGVPKKKPKGHEDASIKEAEFVYHCGLAEATTKESIHVNRMSSIAHTNYATFRDFKRLAAGVGNLERYDKGGSFVDPSGNSSTGVGVFEANAFYIQATTAVGIIDDGLDNEDDQKDEEKARFRAYFTDGHNYVKYDPVDDEVSTWTSRTQSVIPPTCKLIATWQGRVVLARSAENPSAWHMSAIGDPENWDNFPESPSPAQAISGVNAPAGNVPDVINTIIPWDDDLLVFGCETSIWMLRGNPLLGGQLDKLTDQHGMPFGRPWTFDHSGQVLYYADTRGGIHRMVKGSMPVRISMDRIERRLADNVDFLTHYLRLAWNREDEGVHIIQCPFGSSSQNARSLLKHWFYDVKNDAWAEDQFGDGTATELPQQPTAVFLSDGDDPTDRVLLFGCDDGYIRAWDRKAVSDDNITATDVSVSHSGSDVAIDSYVTIGPIQPQDITLETQFQELIAVLGTEYDGCHYHVFVDDEPERGLDDGLILEGSLHSGRNGNHLIKFTGETAYVRLRNASAAQRWEIEKLSMAYAPGGHKRVRS